MAASQVAILACLKGPLQEHSTSRNNILQSQSSAPHKKTGAYVSLLRFCDFPARKMPAKKASRSFGREEIPVSQAQNERDYPVLFQCGRTSFGHSVCIPHQDGLACRCHGRVGDSNLHLCLARHGAHGGVHGSVHCRFFTTGKYTASIEARR